MPNRPQAVPIFENANPVAILRVTDLIRSLDPPNHNVSVDQEIAGFCLDSRRIAPGEVFIAVKGSQVDGHQFVKDAMQRGAAACIVERAQGLEGLAGWIQVPNSEIALGQLAASHRRALNVKVIGLTGSVGKTTTKDFLHGFLSFKGKARKTEGNFNNTLGLPIQLLKLRKEDAWFVAEMGMSTPGEIRQLMAIANPDLGIWLSVQAVHQANFEGGLEAIARAKFELVEGLSDGTTLVYNLDDPIVSRWSAQYPGPKFTYSCQKPSADLRGCVEPFPSWLGTQCKIQAANGAANLQLNAPGRYNVYNLMAAAAAAIAIGMEPYELQQAMPRIKMTPHRSNRIALKDGIFLVDDSYNANPHAVRSVVRAFASLAPSHYRWLVLGDMLELGPDEVAIHEKMGAWLARAGFDRISFVGELSRHAYQAAQAKARDTRLEYFPDSAAAAQLLDCGSPAGARIWCKASRSIRLEQVVDRIQQTLAPDEAAS